MGIFFQHYQSPLCCLCGNAQTPTGEHKIKASALKQEFGQDQLVLIRNEKLRQRTKPVQSVKSKHLKFKTRICERCNSATTQAADEEFEQFHQLASQKLKEGEELETIFEQPEYKRGSQKYLNIFRYFSKLLCCQMAESKSPIPKRLAKFVTGESDFNSLWLDLQSDDFYQDANSQLGIDKYAAHGGLMTYGNEQSYAPLFYYSSLSFNSIQYSFFIQVHPIERSEIRFFYPNFSRLYRATNQSEKSHSSSSNPYQRSGFRKILEKIRSDGT